MKTLLISLTLLLSIGNAVASRPQIILLPDGRQMVCYYYNDGRIVDCQYLWKNTLNYSYTGLLAYVSTLR